MVSPAHTVPTTGSFKGSFLKRERCAQRAVPQPHPLPGAGGVVSGVEVCLSTGSEELGEGTDESYSLSVPAGTPRRFVA